MLLTINDPFLVCGALHSPRASANHCFNVRTRHILAIFNIRNPIFYSTDYRSMSVFKSLQIV